MNPMNIDYRIGSKDLLEPLNRRNIPAQLVHLDYGDINFVGLHPHTKEEVLVGIERKNVDDFVSSMRSNRLGVQIAGMVECYPLARYLLVEGLTRANARGYMEKVIWQKESIRADGNTQTVLCWKVIKPGGGFADNGRVVSHAEWFSYITSISRVAGLEVIQSVDAEDTAAKLATLYKWWQKSEHTSLGVDGLGDVFQERGEIPTRVTQRKPTLCMEWAKCIPGIGPEKARAIGKWFGSARAMANADVEAWVGIPKEVMKPGIGKGRAEKIVRMINEGKGV